LSALRGLRPSRSAEYLQQGDGGKRVSAPLLHPWRVKPVKAAHDETMANHGDIHDRNVVSHGDNLTKT
jgi:hypothetical protein